MIRTFCSKHPARHVHLNYLVLSLNRPQQVSITPMVVEKTFKTLAYVTETCNYLAESLGANVSGGFRSRRLLSLVCDPPLAVTPLEEAKGTLVTQVCIIIRHRPRKDRKSLWK